MALSERLNTPISDAELERRWKAVRAAMADAKIDVLLMQNNNDHMGGYVRYFTDMPATNGYPVTVVFPREDEMTVVCQGPFGGVSDGRAATDVWRGVKQVLTTPSYASAHYTKDYDPELAAKALQPFANGTIGYVGTYQMSFALLDYIKRAFPKATFCRCLRTGRPHQGDQEPGGDGAGQARGGDAGRRHGGRLRRDQARHARRRGRGHRAGTTASRAAARAASISAPPCRSASRRNSATSTCRTASSRKATSSRCWSRTQAPAACSPSSAAPAWSAPRCRRQMKDELEFCNRGAQVHARPAQAGHAVQGHLGRLQRLHAQERPAGRSAALLPRPGLRPGRAAADPQRRAVDDRRRT